MYEAEESLISCLMTEPECIENVINVLSPEMFESSLMGRLYFEYRKAFDDNKSLTLVQLHQNLEKDYPDYEIEDAIKRCALQSALPFQVKGFAEVVVKHYKASCVKAMIDRAEIDDATIDAQIDHMIGDLESLRGGAASEGLTVAQITEMYKDQYFNDNKKDIIFLGDESIDDLTGGFQGGDLCVLAGRPSSGKSALAMQWAQMYAKNGLKVAYYNLEMQTQAVYERLIAAKTGIEIVRIRKATRYLNDEQERYEKAVSELSSENNLMLFTGAKSAADIRKDQREFKFDLIVVDYLQLMVPTARYQGNRAAEVAQISRDLKDICMSFDVPILALSQLNRLSEGRKDKEPVMSDIRESGAIEQDASIIFMIWNYDDQDKSKKAFKTEKSRAGKCQRIDMVFDGAHLSFTNADNIAPFGS